MAKFANAIFAELIHGHHEHFTARRDETVGRTTGRSGHYSNSSDYVRDLIRRDYERAVKVARLQALTTEGIQSGAGTRTMAELKAVAKATAGG